MSKNFQENLIVLISLVESANSTVKLQKGDKYRKKVLRKLRLLPPKIHAMPPKEAILIETPPIELEPFLIEEPPIIIQSDSEAEYLGPPEPESSKRKRRSGEFRKLFNKEEDLAELAYMVDAKDVTVWIDPMDATKGLPFLQTLIYCH